jgi:hypothetical protein
MESEPRLLARKPGLSWRVPTLSDSTPRVGRTRAYRAPSGFHRGGSPPVFFLLAIADMELRVYTLE